jgi:hypothetical protein
MPLLLWWWLWWWLLPSPASFIFRFSASLHERNTRMMAGDQALGRMLFQPQLQAR